MAKKCQSHELSLQFLLSPIRLQGRQIKCHSLIVPFREVRTLIAPSIHIFVTTLASDSRGVSAIGN